jgi:glutamate-1-semialdehyde 2,1-aminomutase
MKPGRGTGTGASLDASARMYSRARVVTPGGVHGEGRTFKPHPIYMKRAQGARIWDVDDNEYIDYHCGFGAVLLGHNDPAVRQAVQEVISDHGIMLATANPLELQLSEKIVEIVPSAEMVLLSCTGSEATYHAIRLARGTTGRPRILKFEGNYHGWHDYVAWNTHFDPDLSVTGEGELRPVPASTGMLRGAEEGVVVCEYNDQEGLRAAFEQHGSSLAAVIVEPIFHNAGVVLPETGFLEGCRELCDQYGTLLIFDEIITGFRHGLGGAQALLGVLPDVSTFGKAMANGFPISAIAGRRDLMSNFVPDGHVLFSGTFTGQLVNVGAAIASIRSLEERNPYARMAALAGRLCQGIQEAIDETGAEAQVKSFGSVWSLYFTRRPITSYRDLAGFAGTKEQTVQRAFQAWSLQAGIYVHPHELVRGYVSAAHSEEDIQRTVEVATGFLRQCRSDRDG